jgi:hypothetical protein
MFLCIAMISPSGHGVLSSVATRIGQEYANTMMSVLVHHQMRDPATPTVSADPERNTR